MNQNEEKDLFKKVLIFLKNFLRNSEYREKIGAGLLKRKSASYIGSSKQNERMLSFKKLNAGSRICFDA